MRGERLEVRGRKADDGRRRTDDGGCSESRAQLQISNYQLPARSASARCVVARDVPPAWFRSVLASGKSGVKPDLHDRQRAYG